MNVADAPSVLEAALAYAASGTPVFPVARNKKPLTRAGTRTRPLTPGRSESGLLRNTQVRTSQFQRALCQEWSLWMWMARRGWPGLPSVA
jgi:hypothetical protein